ncbi:alpha/beta fold hydrolase [Yoonia sediminilitoris]|uniref:Pimeloyl-ACP methyl ester carboxylesterase n=1 Tax=Yoonia sediminilitoris TaxID=1286148 RepID=A0A2T6K9F0_9RHOB|nr:alpha/beta hydrolase [Yoonia sediminilitoris]PUB11346.1 pimeloyl-ACP methyl ester carboxylesterase [Yoonia sediminilitoris]RCW91163.1 pimeloyl-ACP methyl ester carboxylesterase [Yoonia sediminilitoris]
MTPLVLLPGMMCDARLWFPQIAAFSGKRVVQTAPMNGEDICDIATAILADAPPVFALAGLSMGGIVAMEILRQAPERIERIALLDTNPLPELPEVAARREPQIVKVQQGDLIAVMRDEMKPNYLADGPDRSEILDLCMEMAQTLGPEIFAAQSRALQTRPNQVETLEASKIPTLILCGRDDRLCPIARHQLMHDLMPHAEFTIIEGAGHLPTLEQPTETTAAIARWLEAS